MADPGDAGGVVEDVDAAVREAAPAPTGDLPQARSAAYAAVVLDAGPVAYWQCNEKDPESRS